MELHDRNQLEQYLINHFEWFHRHPELPYEEVKTTAKIRELLTEAGIEILPYDLNTGLVAVVRGQKKPTKMSGTDRFQEAQDMTAKCGQGKSVGVAGECTWTAALRCDIDALPIMEEADVPYRSETPGKMHACGHDFHIMAGIGAAILLQKHREELCGTVKFIFQPAEEESHGALKILETNVMDDVEQIWGFHADPTNAVGGDRYQGRLCDGGGGSFCDSCERCWLPWRASGRRHRSDSCIGCNRAGITIYCKPQCECFSPFTAQCNQNTGGDYLECDSCGSGAGGHGAHYGSGRS